MRREGFLSGSTVCAARQSAASPYGTTPTKPCIKKHRVRTLLAIAALRSLPIANRAAVLKDCCPYARDGIAQHRPAARCIPREPRCSLTVCIVTAHFLTFSFFLLFTAAEWRAPARLCLRLFEVLPAPSKLRFYRQLLVSLRHRG